MADDTDKTTQAEKRVERRKRNAAANKVTVILETEVRKAITGQARDAGMDIAPFILDIVEAHLVANAPEGDLLADRLTARHAVLDHVVNLALQADERGEFDQDFILNVMNKASQDSEFMKVYNAAIDSENEDDTRRFKKSLNQKLGRRIKRAAGAKSKRDQAGTILRETVQDEIISIYTLLEKPD